ncbi:hypothetical protein [Vagococcus hydrophili]|uniref:Uncharacterized protein n=1 Tax=Vagococcus hydrophili TaxID=2714947 RepID=A0A6G8AXK1_9ENTE|nr:hypothetical protein [Vagococcus hydrophili]QIL49689.1 hypothetical protein G7082_14850 [Vagococcus hydrophili]
MKNIEMINYNFFNGEKNELIRSEDLFLPIILSEIYFPIALERNSENKLDEETIKILDNLDNQHRMLIILKKYVWDEINKYYYNGNIKENSEAELKRKVLFITKYFRTNRRLLNTKNILYEVNPYSEENINEKNVVDLWIAALLDRLYLSLGKNRVFNRGNIERNFIISKADELNILLNNTQNSIQKNMLNISFSNKIKYFKLPYYLIEEFKKIEEKNYKNWNGLEQSCFAIMNFNNKRYYSVSGIDNNIKEGNIYSAFHEFIENKFGNQYVKVILSDETRYYFNKIGDYIKYSQAKSEDDISRMFSCCETKLISYSFLHNNMKKLNIFIKYEPCRLCRRMRLVIGKQKGNKKKEIIYRSNSISRDICENEVERYDKKAKNIYENF